MPIFKFVTAACSLALLLNLARCVALLRKEKDAEWRSWGAWLVVAHIAAIGVLGCFWEWIRTIEEMMA